jgi:hypothetical protein
LLCYFKKSLKLVPTNKNAAAATGITYFFKWGYHEIENLKLDTKLNISVIKGLQQLISIYQESGFILLLLYFDFLFLYCECFEQ